MSTSKSLADQIDDLLPQTQCTKCGFPDCRAYADAIANGQAAYNQCPPGGAQGIVRLARLLHLPVLPLNEEHGKERPRSVAVIDEAACIGCTLCIQACPVDAIVGAAKQMHSVITALCTGCDLCLPPCPVDCISMVPVAANERQDMNSTPGTLNEPHPGGWNDWSTEQANAARAQHQFRRIRLEREKQENTARLLVKAAEKLRTVQNEVANSPEEIAEKARKQAVINAAMARARQGKTP